MFKNIIWELDKHPLVCIRGRNLDRRSRSGNAVGKTLLPSAIANIINGAPPISIKKKAAQELVQNNARATLTLTNNTTHWSLSQFAKRKSVGYEIIKDNKPLIVKKIDTAREFIRQAMPLSQDHFFSQFYISSFAPSVLLYGNATNRMQHFEQIFDLRVHDLMRRALLNELQEINGKFSQQQMLQKQRRDLLPQVKQDLTQRLRQIKIRHKELLNNYQQTNKQVQDLIAYTTLAEQLSSDATLRELQQQQQSKQQQLHIARKNYRKLQRQLGALRNSTKIRTTRHKLLQQLAKLPIITKTNLSTRLVKIVKYIAKLENRITIYHKYEAYIINYHRIVQANLQFPFKDQVITSDKLQQQATELAYNIKQRQKLQGGKACPLCGEIVNNSTHKHVLQQWHKKLTRVKTKLSVTKQVEMCRKLEQKIPTKIIHLDIGRTQQQLIKQRRRYKKLQQQQQIVARRKELQQRLLLLPKSSKIKPISQRRITQATHNIDKLEEQQNRITNDIKLLEKLNNMAIPYDDLTAAKTALRHLQNNINTIAPKLQTISDKMHRFSSQQAEYNAAMRQLTEIEQELTILDKVVADRDVVEALARAYSSKGIRILQIRAFVTAYTNALNALAANLYFEPVKFYNEVDNNQCDLLIERHNKISDIRRLSGSESRQFLAVSALALIGLMPSHLRCQQIILDELESGIAPVDRQFFTNEFIPALANSIKHVIIITPNNSNDMPIPNAVELLLERKNGFSRWR